jgi:hypothetical protein
VVIAICQCTTFSGAAGNCTSSEFELSDLSFETIEGTSTSDVVASLQCSAVKPCRDILIDGVDLTVQTYCPSIPANSYLCGNVEGTPGFNCTGDVCVHGSATGGCWVMGLLVSAISTISSKIEPSEVKMKLGGGRAMDQAWVSY